MITARKDDYQRLPIEDFGQHLLLTGDLDPIYIMLKKALHNGVFLNVAHLKRWCLAYWCFYHAGVASYIAGYEEFWLFMGFAAANKSPVVVNGKQVRWPRGAERRHFRGDAAVSAVERLSYDFPRPEDFVNQLVTNLPGDFKSIFKAVKRQPQFGPWIAFKVVDMLANVFDYDIDLSGADLNIYEEPGKGAEMACLRQWDVAVSTRRVALDVAISRLRESLRSCHPLHAPHRAPGVMEIETVLCKWKSHMNGSYPLLKDTQELRHCLHGWGPIADGLLHCVPV